MIALHIGILRSVGSGGSLNWCEASGSGYNNLKGKRTKVEVGVPCPACGEEMIGSVHVDKRRIVKNLGDVGYKSAFVDEEFDESGEPNYVEVVGGGRFE